MRLEAAARLWKGHPVWPQPPGARSRRTSPIRVLAATLVMLGLGMLGLANETQADGPTLVFNTGPRLLVLDDPDSTTAPAVFTIIQNPGHGLLLGTPPFLSYTPEHDYTGPDSLRYSVREGNFIHPAVTLTLDVRPIPTVPAGHPRVYVSAADLPSIQQKIQEPEFADAWESIQAGAAGDHETAPLCRAFIYLVTGDEAMGHSAIDQALVTLWQSDESYSIDVPMHWGACVYDWCHDLLTEGQKDGFVQAFIRLAELTGPSLGYPASPTANVISGHYAEGWVMTGQLPVGLAIYDREPTMYDAAARLFFNRFIELRDFHYAGHAHHQGDSYGTRMNHELAVAWLFRRLGAGDIFSRNQRFAPYEIVYNKRPDDQSLRHGDTWDHFGLHPWKRLACLLAGSYYEDPILLGVADSDRFLPARSFDRVFELLFRPLGFGTQPLSQLPRAKYFGEPIGELVMRTGWNFGVETSHDAVVSMRIGTWFFGNHRGKDAGTFQIYYRGQLASVGGSYNGGHDHWVNYYHQTVSRNGLLILDPGEVQTVGSTLTANDGGQRWPSGSMYPNDLRAMVDGGYEAGDVLARAIGPDPVTPEYALLEGDITDAYSAKVDRVTRSMVAFATGRSDYPCTFVVLDRVTAATPTFTKTWLLHTLQEPTIDGRTITVVRDEGSYGGKLVVESLLPAAATITPYGGPGQDFWISGNQTHYEPDMRKPEDGWGHVEISPATPATEDLFLHAMSVMDAGEVPPAPALLIETEQLVGVVAVGQAVLFSRTGELLDEVEFDYAGSGEARFLICNLQPGPWYVHLDSTSLDLVLDATATGHAVYFQGGPGSYLLAMEEMTPETENPEGGGEPGEQGEPEGPGEPEEPGSTPPVSQTQLLSPRPHPVLPGSIMPFTLLTGGRTEFRVYDIAGRMIRQIDRGHLDAGLHQLDWESLREAGSMFPTGIYIYEMRVDGVLADRRKIVSLK